MKKHSIYSAIFAIIGIFALAGTTLAVGFDPNYILSDQEILEADSMTLQEIDAFLKSKGGYIAYHSFPNFEGKMKTAAEIIYDAAHNWDCDGVSLSDTPTEAERRLKCQPVTINPKFLIVLLQKEQSLIEEKSPKQSQLDWATGYGCPDGGGCNDHWRGFGKQVNSASLQFFDYLQNPRLYTYKQGNSYRVSNTNKPDMNIQPKNQATAALYNYTPHVYNGNYNFYNIWNRYFTRQYPNNTLMQVRGEPGVWLIQNGYRRPFLSKGALTSRYDPNKIVSVAQSDLDKYPTGDPIKFAQYSLVRSPRGTVYLLVDDTRRGFNSQEALRMIGINPEEIVNAGWDDINVYKEGQPITATSSYPMGALLQDKSTGGIFYVFEGTKAPLWDKVLLQTKFRGRVIIPETPEKLASYKTVEPAIFGDGELIKLDGGPGVFVIDNGSRRAFTSGAIFEALGYKWGNIITVPKKIFDLYPEGQPISQIYTDEDGIVQEGTAATTTEDETTAASGTPEIIDTPVATTTDDEALQQEINSILNP